MPNSERIPRQENCDPKDPDEHFLWALCSIPYGDKVAQPIQPNIARLMSRHLHELGFRHHPKLQKKKFQPPHRGQQHSLNASNGWVPMDAEDPDPVVLPNVGAMTRHEQELLKTELEDVGIIPPPPKHLGKTAEITSFREIQTRHIRKASELEG